MSTRRIVIGSGLTLLLACAGYGVFWLIAAHNLEQAFHNWAEQRRAAGDVVRYGDIRIDGFPSALRMYVADPGYTSLEHDFSWQGDGARLSVRPWSWRDIHVDFEGGQSVEIAAETVGPRVVGRAPGAQLTGRLHPNGRLADGMLEITDATLSAPLGIAIDIRFARLDITQPLQEPGGHDQMGLGVRIHVEDVRLSEALVPQFGTEIPLFELAGHLFGQPPRRLDHAAVNAWRETGGTLEVSSMTLRWGPLDLRAQGTVSLDAKMRPLGAMTADIRGYHVALSALEEGRVVKGNAVTGLRVAVELLSRRDGEGEGRVLSLPIAAQNGYFHLGPVRLFRLDPITFPAP